LPKEGGKIGEEGKGAREGRSGHLDLGKRGGKLTTGRVICRSQERREDPLKGKRKETPCREEMTLRINIERDCRTKRQTLPIVTRKSGQEKERKKKTPLYRKP